jgi:hypothetical protein
MELAGLKFIWMYAQLVTQIEIMANFIQYKKPYTLK